MRQLRFCTTSQALNALAFSIVLLASAPFAHALITLDSVDESRVSSVAGVTSSTDNVDDDDDDASVTTIPIIYGGVAGKLTRGTCADLSSTSTCDNCALESNSEVEDDRLLACNNRRIHGALQIRLTVKSDSIDSGRAMMTYTPSSSTETALYNGSNDISKGNAGEITINWSDICAKMTLSGGSAVGGAENCVLPASSDSAAVTVKVGIDKYESGTRDQLLGATDEYTQIQFILRNGIRTASTSSDVSVYSSTDSDMAISYFEIGSGDKKAYIKDRLTAPSGFPTANSINIRWVRALYQKREVRTAPVWDQIKPDSPHSDLEVSGDTTTAIELSPRRIEGLENDQIYDFKLAMVDAARNVGYYTPKADDQTCEDSDAAGSPESGLQECHTARPAEVVGVLSDTMNCFVATASYGSPMAKEVVTFRAFRDRFLMPNSVGRAFVKNYYKYGPIAAAFIAKNETLRASGRAVLWAPLQFVKFSLTYGFLAAFALLSTIIIAPPALWVGARRFRKPRAT